MNHAPIRPNIKRPRSPGFKVAGGSSWPQESGVQVGRGAESPESRAARFSRGAEPRVATRPDSADRPDPAGVRGPFVPNHSQTARRKQRDDAQGSTRIVDESVCPQSTRKLARHQGLLASRCSGDLSFECGSSGPLWAQVLAEGDQQKFAG